MTKTKFYLQFFFVAAFFVLPPLFAPFFPGGESAVEFTGFSWWNAACFLAALLLIFFLGEFHGDVFCAFPFSPSGGSRGLSSEKNGSQKDATLHTKFFDSFFRGIFSFFSSKAGKLRRVIVFAEFLKTFGLLCASQAFFECVGLLMKVRHEANVVFPKSVAEALSCAAAFLVAAFYEEVLYRAYLPFSLKMLFRKKIPPKKDGSDTENKTVADAVSAQGESSERVFDAAFEFAAIAIFAFSHFKNGFLAVANAAVAGFFLRRCAVKTDGIKAGFFAHFLYNALTLALLMMADFYKI